MLYFALGLFLYHNALLQTQEEMAMQIAQMIISDVTRVTQGGPTGQEPS